MQVLDEVVDLGAQLAGVETERGFDRRADLHLVAARVPFPHRRARAIDGERAQLQLARRGAEQRLQRAEGELRDGKADEHEDEHQAGDEAEHRGIARQAPRQHHRGAEHPDEEQDPRRDQRQRPILAAQGEEQGEGAADGANDDERGARESGGQARIDHRHRDQRQLGDDPHREQHAYEAVPERDAQEHGYEDDETGGNGGFARRSIDRVVLRSKLEQLMEEAEVDA